jgi:glycosyltransferase involved in cell wall biosynthesis
MITGSYFPETTGAGLQCRALVGAIGGAARFAVLTTALDPSLPAHDDVDGVPVRRLLVSARSRVRRWLAAPRLIAACVAMARRADIVHLHGFSTKSRIVVAITRLLGKRVIIKMTSVGHDDPMAMRAKGARVFGSFARADRFVGVSPRFEELYAQSELPPDRFRLIPNGVDLDRFRPPTEGERAALRRMLGLPVDRPVVLFVGFFSHEKCPELAFDAWTDAEGRAPQSTLVLVGQTRSDYYEIDEAIAPRIRRTAERLGRADRLVLVERAAAIEQFYRAADVFVLPTLREGLPNAVLEAMASGVACVVSRLPRVTDTLIADGVDGRLVEPGDRAGFASALSSLLADQPERDRLGAAARRTIQSRFGLAATAAQYLSLYRELA